MNGEKKNCNINKNREQKIGSAGSFIIEKSNRNIFHFSLVLFFHFIFPLISSVGSRWVAYKRQKIVNEKKATTTATQKQPEKVDYTPRLQNEKPQFHRYITHVSPSLFFSFTTHNLHIPIH